MDLKEKRLKRPDIYTTLIKLTIWAEEKGLLDRSNILAQFDKLTEEHRELGTEILEVNRENAIMELGDNLVVLNNLAYMIGTTFEEALDLAYNKIKNRKGKTVNGCFIKE